MPKQDRGMAGSQAVADRAIRAAREALARDVDQRGSVPVLKLTQAELDDLNLLCDTLGFGVNACVNFATKYLCSLWLYSTVNVKTPRPQTPTKKNPQLSVDYQLNPEVLAAVRAARERKPELRSVVEEELVKQAVLYLCKKLLPSKPRRLLVGNGSKAEAS